MWQKVIGHGRQIDELKRTLASGNLPNAYLFQGPHGVGKRFVAETFAMACICDTTCGVCASCRKIINKNHPDCFIVEPESNQPNESESKTKKSENIKIEQVRELQAALQYHPLEAKMKIAMIDESEKMTESCANSLLKILEEPPPNTHFILISAIPHKLLPTIRSRCRQISFGPLPDSEIASEISKKKNISTEGASLIAKFSGGSLGTAMSMDPELMEDILGRFNTILKDKSSSHIMETAEEWSHNKINESKLILDIIAMLYRDALKILVSQDFVNTVHPKAKELAEKITIYKAEKSIDELISARHILDTSVNKQLMFENLLFTLAG